MEKHITLSLLYEFYQSLLTPKQADLIDLYYNQDFSLSEISEMKGITRQAVRDHLLRGEKQLLSYEEKLNLAKRFLTIKQGVSKVHALAMSMSVASTETEKEQKTAEMLTLLNHLLGDEADGI